MATTLKLSLSLSLWCSKGGVFFPSPAKLHQIWVRFQQYWLMHTLEWRFWRQIWADLVLVMPKLQFFAVVVSQPLFRSKLFSTWARLCQEDQENTSVGAGVGWYSELVWVVTSSRAGEATGVERRK